MFFFSMAHPQSQSVERVLVQLTREAPKCTVVTTSSRLPLKVKTWAQNSDAEHRIITNRTLKRLGFWKGIEMR